MSDRPSFLEELKRRKVVRVAVGWLGGRFRTQLGRIQALLNG